MKKRFLALLLAAAVSFTLLAVPAIAADSVRFSDVTDQTTATAIEVLRLMGVLNGYEDGTFRPANQLTRAQFCKMTVHAMDSTAELGRYRTVTIFPDVKPSYWAAGYINLAAKGKHIIAGYADGMFRPDRTVTVGQAVTILLRLLGYKDEEVGGVWPDSYMAVGAEIGLTDGVGSNGNAALTRAQAARLFLNLLDADKNGGGTLYSLSAETELRSVDGSTGKLTTADGSYTMVNPVASTSLIGAIGHVVLNAQGKALTFLPVSEGNSGTADAAVVVNTNGSAAGFSDLAGSGSYALYKNGLPISKNDLRKHDVATYSAATNSIRVCDTRVTVYYESCEPSPDAPTRITTLGGMEFSVLPTARDSLSEFKPGMQMTLLLTADGQVAAAKEASGAASRGNAVGIVSDSGSISLLCGTNLIPLKLTAEAKYHGQVVRLSSSKKGSLNLAPLSGSVPGDLNIDAKTLGSKKLTENVMVFENGQQVNLSQITSGVIKASQIVYARTNWAGNVDLIVLGGGQSAGTIYGKAVIRTSDNGDGTTTTVEVLYGGKSTGAIQTAFDVPYGSYVAATVSNGKYTNITPLSRLKNVSEQSWVGETMVLYGGVSYSVAKDVLCYNADSDDWITLKQALDYTDSFDLYVKDGIVRVIEVTHK